MDTIGGFDDGVVNMLDADVGNGATVRTLVFHNVRRRAAMSIELRVTGVTSANLTLRMLGQNTTPAADPTRLLPLTLDLPDLSTLVADYTGVFLVPVYSAYVQFEVVSTSGAVHVKIDAEGSDASFDDASKASTIASLVQLAAGSNLVGSVLATLQAGANAIGKLAANVGVNIGTVDVASLPSLVLAAGTAAIGKLAANAGVNIGTVDVATYTPFIDTVASADTSAHAYGTSQVVKAPAFVRAARTMTGTVTISDGTHTGMVLNGGDSMPVQCTNLNQITYQFSINASSTEKFSMSVGI